MKIDRLLSIIVYLLNRELVSARELAERFEVSVRTIQRDMETINMAGIPVIAVQGPSGGYGIMDTYKMDRQLVSLDDLFYIITSLSSIGCSLTNKKIQTTIEKMKSLLPGQEEIVFSKKHEKLHIDFSMLGSTPRHHKVFGTIEKAIEDEQLLQISYTNTKLESTDRILEPLTIVFKWRSWYLYAYCRLKEDFRLFRLSRIKKIQSIEEHFTRRDKPFDQFIQEAQVGKYGKMVDLVLAFHPKIKPLVEEFYTIEETSIDQKGRLIVKTSMPEDGWVYGMILSYGSFVEVLSPDTIRTIVKDIAQNIFSTYASASNSSS